MAYINEGNGPSLVANSVATLSITWFFFSIRIYVRWFMMKVWKIEDWLFVGAQVTFSLLSICALLAAVHGNGQHLIAIQLTDIPLAMQYWFICEIFYVLTAILLRLSFGFFLLRICVNKAHVWTIRVTMAVMSLTTIAYFFFVIFQCHPVSYFWLQFSGLVGKCLDATLVQNVTISYSVFAAATDMVFGILPIFVIWNLKMNKKAKMVVGVLLTLGIIAGLSVIVRIEYIKLVNLTDDFLFATSKVSIWSMIEPAISICCLASSTYRPLFSSLKDRATTNYAYGGTANKIGSSYAKKSQITTGSIPEQPNWRLSKSLRSGSNKTGYLRSNNDGANHGISQSQGSFDDIIALESMACGPGTSPGSRAGSDEKEKREGSDKGIWHSTTVEITRQNVDDRI